MRVFWFLIGASCAIAACGQTVVEHSAASAGATAATGSMSGAGKSMGGVFRGLSETIDKSRSANQGETPPATPRSAQPKPSQKPVSARESKQALKPVPAATPIDPSQLTTGLERNELIKRFGEPAMRLSESNGSQLVERFWYNATAQDQIEIIVIDGKVAWVLPPPSKKQDEPLK